MSNTLTDFYYHGKVLINSEEICKAIKHIEPQEIAVAYIGKDFENFIDTSNLNEIVVSPTLGSNPYAIEQIADMIGWKNVHFLDNLHAKIYIGKDSAVLASSNLSQNGLFGDSKGLIEIGTYISDNNEYEKVIDRYLEIVDKSNYLYPDIESKKMKVEDLKKIYRNNSNYIVELNETKENNFEEIETFEELPKQINKLVYKFQKKEFKVKTDPLFKIKFTNSFFEEEELLLIINEAINNIEDFNIDECEKFNYFDFFHVEKGIYNIGEWVLLCSVDSNFLVTDDIDWCLITNIFDIKFSYDDENKRFIAIDVNQISDDSILPPFQIQDIGGNIEKFRNIINKDEFKEIREYTGYANPNYIFEQRKLRAEIIKSFR